MSIKIFKGTQIIPFLLLSLLLHLGLIFASSALKSPLKRPFSLPIPVEVIELPPIPTGKVEEPRDIKRLAQRAQRVERETAPPAILQNHWPEKEATKEEPPVVLPRPPVEEKVEPPPKEERVVIATEDKAIPPAVVSTLPKEEGEAKKEGPPVALPKAPIKEGEVEPPQKALEGPREEEKAVIITEEKGVPTVVATIPEEGEKPKKEAPVVLPRPPAKEEKEVYSTISKAPLKEERVETPKEEKAVKERDIKLFPSQERLTELEREYQSKTEGVEEGKTLSLDTSEFRYESYLTGIKRKIELVWRYPDVAARAGQQGRLELRFTIRKDGGLEGIRLIKSSGYPILDDEALSAVRLAAPFSPFPKGFNVERINIVATFEYIIETFYYRQIR